MPVVLAVAIALWRPRVLSTFQSPAGDLITVKFQPSLHPLYALMGNGGLTCTIKTPKGDIHKNTLTFADTDIDDYRDVEFRWYVNGSDVMLEEINKSLEWRITADRRAFFQPGPNVRS